MAFVVALCLVAAIAFLVAFLAILWRERLDAWHSQNVWICKPEAVRQSLLCSHPAQANCACDRSMEPAALVSGFELEDHFATRAGQARVLAFQASRATH